LHQVGWTRALLLSFGSSVHAFTLVLSSFILGLGLGGLAAPLARAPGARLPAFLVAAEAAAGLGGLLAAARAGDLPLEVIRFLGGGPPEYAALLRWEAGRALAIVLIPTAAMGAVFPLLVAALARGASGASAAVGRVTLVNTLGVLAGSLGGGLLLLPALGTRGTLVAASALNLLLAAGVAAAALPRRAGIPAAALLAVLAAAAPALAPPWPLHRVHCGPFLYASRYAEGAGVSGSGRDLDRVLRDLHWDMPFSVEGRSLAAAVLRAPDGNAYLRINGKTDASSVEDMDTQTLAGHVPLLLHPAPRRVMVVGLATGVTAAAAASHRPEALDVAEISPEVREAEREFRGINGDVTARPFVHVLLEDGRTHLEHASALYDVVISEPTNPWIAGVSDLFTVEYFRAVRARLAPGGIAAVWVQAYGLTREDFRLALRSFREVFPGAAVFEPSPWQDYLLVAPRDGVLDAPAALAARPWPSGEAAGSLGSVGIRSREELLGLLLLDAGAAAAFAGEGELHTDDRLQLEFRAPRRALGGEGGAFSREEIEALRREQPLPAGAGVDGAAMEGVRTGRGMALEALACQRGSRDGRLGGPLLRGIVDDPGRMEALLPEIPRHMREPLAASLRAGLPPFRAGADRAGRRRRPGRRRGLPQGRAAPALERHGAPPRVPRPLPPRGRRRGGRPAPGGRALARRRGPLPQPALRAGPGPPRPRARRPRPPRRGGGGPGARPGGPAGFRGGDGGPRRAVPRREAHRRGPRPPRPGPGPRAGRPRPRRPGAPALRGGPPPLPPPGDRGHSPSPREPASPRPRPPAGGRMPPRAEGPRWRGS
ncbi:MAG: hypothetical protein L6R43_14940, partial [Planctomycetes bacterium]|nr:hypothetical protein [Planctomycetota bacterium]